jgi:propionyl-CoA carboxylase alpha chain
MNTRKRQISGQLRAPSRLVFDLKRVVVFGAKQVKLEVQPRRDGIDVIFEDGARLRVDSPWTPGHAVWRGEIDETPVSAQLRLILNGFEVAHGGAQIAARVFTEPEAEFAGLMLERKSEDNSKALLCPMPGLVKTIAVREGQEVKAGEPLCMVEAMKMENVLLAERDATITKILAKSGDSLAVDAVIMEFA